MSDIPIRRTAPQRASHARPLPYRGGRTLPWVTRPEIATDQENSINARALIGQQRKTQQL